MKSRSPFITLTWREWSALQVATRTDLVRLGEPFGEGVVELIKACHCELMHEQNPSRCRSTVHSSSAAVTIDPAWQPGRTVMLRTEAFSTGTGSVG